MVCVCCRGLYHSLYILFLNTRSAVANLSVKCNASVIDMENAAAHALLSLHAGPPEYPYFEPQYPFYRLPSSRFPAELVFDEPETFMPPPLPVGTPRPPAAPPAPAIAAVFEPQVLEFHPPRSRKAKVHYDELVASTPSTISGALYQALNEMFESAELRGLPSGIIPEVFEYGLSMIVTLHVPFAFKAPAAEAVLREYGALDTVQHLLTNVVTGARRLLSKDQIISSNFFFVALYKVIVNTALSNGLPAITDSLSDSKSKKLADAHTMLSAWKIRRSLKWHNVAKATRSIENQRLWVAPPPPPPPLPPVPSPLTGLEMTARRVMAGDRPFKCGSCDAAFAQKGNLTQHARTHSGERPFVCGSCDAAFAHKSNLNTHMRIHTGEKQFACGSCDAAFVRKDDLARHARTHTGEKPYKCGSCDYASAQLGNLKSHCKAHGHVRL